MQQLHYFCTKFWPSFCTVQAAGGQSDAHYGGRHQAPLPSAHGPLHFALRHILRHHHVHRELVDNLMHIMEADIKPHYPVLMAHRERIADITGMQPLCFLFTKFWPILAFFSVSRRQLVDNLMRIMEADIKPHYPVLMAHRERIADMPGIKEYLNSPRRPAQVCNLYFLFHARER